MLPRVAIHAALAAFLAAHVASHSWIDCIDHSYDVVYTNSDRWALSGLGGNGVCEGYAYKYPGRGVNTIGTDFTHKLLPADIANDAPVCQYRAKDADYTGWRKQIVAKPGDKLYFAYFSNGHVVKDKAGPGTTHGVYWDGRPGVELERPSQLTSDHLVSPLQDFDDGSCGETYLDGDYAGGTITSGRAGDFKPCIGSFTIPSSTRPGTYPMVWWWTFFKPTDLANNFHNFEGAGGAAYSSCFNVIVKAGASSKGIKSDAVQGEADVVESLAAVEARPIVKEAAPVKCDVAGDATPAPAPSPAKTNQQPPIMGTVHALAEPAAPAPVTATPAITPAPVTATPTATPAPVSPAPVAASPAPVTTSPSVTPFIPSNIFAAPLSAITITGVGGKGTYGKVINMPCPSGDASSSAKCIQTPFDVSGPLAPFDEDLTLALRGPLEIDDIAVFTKTDVQWTKVSSYSHTQANATQNMVFLNNKGDATKSGEFSMCHGNSQSYATSDGTTAASASTAFSGVLADGVEVNVMSATTCAASGKTDGGFARGVAHEGWSGNHKIFMVKAQMPHAASGKDLPAIWLMNGQIVRTAQYGCNCRGMGDNGVWKGGCGELDVAEIIPENKDMLTSTIYSFKGSRGTSPVTARPSDARVVFVVILSTSPSSPLGTAQILMMRPEDVDIQSPPSAQRVDEWLAYRNGKLVDFDI